ncbi:hypothetical protein TRAPUB_484 [Trametes pubescens]|uniref:Uncharacterized protein n=1 Tax=Trametes pubescens TaxID=154538 RepID=A0A1M2VM11_TRAPU|nr:hypothetical protein TRAPUB_484 [Trametes pubescens]
MFVPTEKPDDFLIKSFAPSRSRHLPMGDHFISRSAGGVQQVYADLVHRGRHPA